MSLPEPVIVRLARLLPSAVSDPSASLGMTNMGLGKTNVGFGTNVLLGKTNVGFGTNAGFGMANWGRG